MTDWNSLLNSVNNNVIGIINSTNDSFSGDGIFENKDQLEILLNTAKKNGFKIMLGCMVGTSLAMAPALLLSNLSDIVDLDGPLFLKQDRKNHLEYKDFLAFPISKRLWGY